MSTSNTAEIVWWTCLMYVETNGTKTDWCSPRYQGTYAHGGAWLRTLQNDTKTAVVTNSSKGLTVMVGLKLGTWFLKSWKRKSGKFVQRNKICQSNESCVALDYPVFVALPHYTIIGWFIPLFFWIIFGLSTCEIDYYAAMYIITCGYKRWYAII